MNFYQKHSPNGHVSNGGDGITNFEPLDAPIYMEAVKLHGDSDLWISDHGYDGDRLLYSLRCKQHKELGPFWKVFEEVAAKHGGTRIEKC